VDLRKGESNWRWMVSLAGRRWPVCSRWRPKKGLLAAAAGELLTVAAAAMVAPYGLADDGGCQ